MPNPEITNNDTLQVPVFNPLYKDASVNFAGADTYLRGTVMARVGVSAGAVTPVLVGGDGTLTNFALAGGGLAVPGDYNLECTVAVADGGVFKLEDPNGNIVADNLEMIPGAGGATDMAAAGLGWTLTDGAANFAVGDAFTLNVVDEGEKWTPYVDGAVDGSGIASGVLPAALTATGAGDLLRRMIVGGEMAKDVMVIDGGVVGTIPESVVLSLRNFGIVVREGVRVDELDNQ